MKLILLWSILLLNTFVFTQLEKTHLTHFTFGSVTPTEAETSSLNSFLQKTDSTEILSIEIIGFADDVGPKQINDALSLKRAENIEQIISKSDFPFGKITSVKGVGSILPLSSDPIEIEEERKNNRRVELRIKLKPKELISEEPKIEPRGKPLFSEDTKVGEIIKLENILFEPGSHNMYPQSEESLKRLLFYMKRFENIHITILGHICCQSDGQDGVNKETGLKNLSEARAQVVYFYLVQKGIDKKRLEFKGMKGNFPLGFGDLQDRRVEIQIKKK